MTRNILIIQGHPDPDEHHFCHALADAYASGAEEAGHALRRVEVAKLRFSLLRSKQQFDEEPVTKALMPAQEAIGWADHIVIVYPLWLGTMPALLKGFLEQVLRPGFAFIIEGKGWRKNLKGKTARIVVTMGMPAFIYRFYFGAHGLRNLKRNILHFSGIKPARATLIGMVEALSEAKRDKWLEKLAAFGREGR